MRLPALPTVPRPRRLWVDSTVRAGALVLAFGIAAGCAARVADLAWERRGDFWVLETNPICQSRGWNAQAAVLSRPPEVVPVGQALSRLDFEVLLPVWVPEGYAIRERVPPPSEPFENVWVYWERTGPGEPKVISLWLQPAGLYEPEIVAPAEAVDWVDIRGQQALLVRGGCALATSTWSLESSGGAVSEWVLTDWDETRASLTWLEGGLRYELELFGPPATADDLVRMAKSMQPVGGD
jgi:hypothetical protein